MTKEAGGAVPRGAVTWTLVLIVLAVHPVISMTVTHRRLSADAVKAESRTEQAGEEVEDTKRGIESLQQTASSVAVVLEETAATGGQVTDEVAQAASEVTRDAEATQANIEQASADLSRATDTDRVSPRNSVNVLWWKWRSEVDALALWLLVVAGILGAALKSLSLARKLGSGGSDEEAAQAGPPWMWYFGRPVAGAATAFVVYVGIRAGLLNVGINSARLNAFGLAGIGVAAGYLTERFLERLSVGFGTDAHPARGGRPANAG